MARARAVRGGHVLQPLALRAFRPLVLPEVARCAPDIMPSTRVSASVSVPTISVERRPLAAYTRLTQFSEQRSALAEEVA
jgi:hypothetical protein